MNIKYQTDKPKQADCKHITLKLEEDGNIVVLTAATETGYSTDLIYFNNDDNTVTLADGVNTSLGLPLTDGRLRIV